MRRKLFTLSFFRKFFAFSFTLLLVFTSKLMALDASKSSCPQYKHEGCVKLIKSQMTNFEYASASLNAELQCYNGSETSNLDVLNERRLSYRALGCYYSFLVERFLGNPLRSQSALDQATRLIKFGCLYQLSWLCRLSGDIFELEKVSLRNEMIYDIEDMSASLRGEEVYIFVYIPRILPEAAKLFFSNFMAHELKERNVKILQCNDCNRYETGKPSLSIVLKYIADRLTASVKVFQPQTKKFSFEKHYGYPDARDFDEVFASLGRLEDPRLKNYNQFHLHKPIFNLKLSLGFAHIGNYALAEELDQNRIIVGIRSTESFNYGRDEYGLEITSHQTQRSLYSEDSPEPASETEIPVYPKAGTISFRYGHIFFADNRFKSTPHLSIGVGAGAFLTGTMYASVADLEFSVRVGKRYSFDFKKHFISSSKMKFSSTYNSAKAREGSEIAFACHF